MLTPWMPPLPAAWQATKRYIASTRLRIVHCWQVFRKPQRIFGNSEIKRILCPGLWTWSFDDLGLMETTLLCAFSLSLSLFISRMELCTNETCYWHRNARAMLRNWDFKEQILATRFARFYHRSLHCIWIWHHRPDCVLANWVLAKLAQQKTYWSSTL